MKYRVVIEDTMETHYIVEAQSREDAAAIANADHDNARAYRVWFDVIKRDVAVNQPRRKAV